MVQTTNLISPVLHALIVVCVHAIYSVLSYVQDSCNHHHSHYTELFHYHKDSLMPHTIYKNPETEVFYLHEKFIYIRKGIKLLLKEKDSGSLWMNKERSKVEQ